LLLGGFQDWFTESGFTPGRTAFQYYGEVDRRFAIGTATFTLPFSVPRLNLMMVDLGFGFAATFYILLMLAAILTTVGFWTRVSSILLAIGIVSLHHRNPLILHGGDTVLRICVLYLAIAPSGAACSLDRLRAIWKGERDASPQLISMWPQRLIAFNVAVVYFTTFWHKAGFGDAWRDGSATWYTARLAEFHKWPTPPWLNDFPLVRVTTYGTLAMELLLGTLVFYRPLRKWILLGGLAMHGYIEYSMNIPLFAFCICSMYVTFYDGEETEAWAKRLGTRMKGLHARLLLPSETRLRPAANESLTAADCFGLIRSEESDEVVKSVSPDRIWTRLPGTWVFAWVPGLWKSLVKDGLEPVAVEPVRNNGAPIKKSKAPARDRR
jgi:hypothetical protein